MCQVCHYTSHAAVIFDKRFLHSGKQFDVNGAILNSLAGLEVTLDVDSVIKLDDFQTELAFKQFNVPAVVCCILCMLYKLGADMAIRRTEQRYS
jgi:hypothetical protein